MKYTIKSNLESIIIFMMIDANNLVTNEIEKLDCLHIIRCSHEKS